MTYQGDPSLTPDIQTRVLSTFDQTSKLAAEGRLQEALLGCDFILRLDPLFTPAKRLQERLDGATGPVEVEPEPTAAAPEAAHTVRLSAEELRRLMDVEDSDQSPVEEVIERGPLAEAEAWQSALHAGEGEGGESTSFLAGARRALDSGQIEAARRLLDMAGSLDPHAPELLELRAELDRVTSSPADSRGGDRIAQLLAEGQSAFDDERFQDAIDCWSRIFLIEIDHEDATRRIQLARDLREEQDRQVEETFHQGVAAADAGRKEQAATAFRRVLQLRPNHLAAREHLDRLGGEARPAGAATAKSASAPAQATAPGVVPADLQVAPDEAPRHADPTYRMAARAKRKPVNPFLLIGAGALLLVGLGAWLLLDNWGRLFPNAKEESGPAPKSRLEQIKAMHAGGELEAAIAAIEQIGPDSGEYLAARRLLTQWREELAGNAVAMDALTGDDATRHADLIVRARQFYDEREYLEAARLFARASAMAPLQAPEAALFDDSKRQLEPIAQQIDLYTQRQWELVLPALWRRLEQVPDDKVVHALLVDSYYNMAVRELRRGDVPGAATHLQEAARLDRDDAELLRLEQFVTSYSSLPRDLLFEIYVQHVEFRP